MFFDVHQCNCIANVVAKLVFDEKKNDIDGFSYVIKR